ncbi:hypothetical protein SAMN05421736_101364 [Evansella caseinilytica]|uniref:Uncharacterized protein n=1 Tax=Evansella caseinilytica TaxID=1503961 RepID=A0A1H3H3C6_9BACI|nr:hypothetical protein SAMN05421736_101364 [Evansella caseinilytica]
MFFPLLTLISTLLKNFLETPKKVTVATVIFQGSVFFKMGYYKNKGGVGCEFEI